MHGPDRRLLERGAVALHHGGVLGRARAVASRRRADARRIAPQRATPHD